MSIPPVSIPPMVPPSSSSTVAFMAVVVAVAVMIVWGTRAVLSSPFPFRVFMDEPAVVLVFHFPYGLILPMCVAPALAGHLLVFRWLWRRSPSPSPSR